MLLIRWVGITWPITSTMRKAGAIFQKEIVGMGSPSNGSSNWSQDFREFRPQGPGLPHPYVDGKQHPTYSFGPTLPLQAWQWPSPADFPEEEEEESPKQALVVTMPWDKGDGADPDMPGLFEDKMELPQSALEPALDTELPLEDRRWVQGHPKAGGLGLSGQDSLEDSPAQVAGLPLLLGDLIQSPRSGGSRHVSLEA